MDPKALARSKRSHTQHHSKKPHHPNQKLKAPAAVNAESGNAKTPSEKHVGGSKTHQSKGLASLPSNWDRYEEEFDLVSVDASADGKGSAHSDVVLPKSKGADYAHLISEAQSNSKAQLDPFASLADSFPDFNQGVGCMLSVRGQSILSWIEDKNFVVDDRAAPTHEAPFLSLNLNILAEQLSRVELSERLFIEPELLQPELCTETSVGSSPQEYQETHDCSSEATSRENEISVHNSDEKKVSNQNIMLPSRVPRDPFPTASNRQLNPAHHIEDRLRRSDESSQSIGESIEFPKKNVAADNKDTSVFKASDAEAELDMLLGSFSETDFLDTGKEKPSFTPTLADQSPNLMPDPDLSKPASVTANFDNDIDDLLKDTSDLINRKNPPASRDATANSSLLSVTNGKSKVLDDFDSWLDTI